MLSARMQPTFFEGPEKKVELVVVPEFPSLRSLGEESWQRVIHAAGATAISMLKSDACDAYLLSESSLFVHDDYVTMITCGRTQLVDAVKEILNLIPAESIALLIYERKNEHFPEQQATSFYDDARELSKLLPGQAVRFGDAHGHCVQMFCTARTFVPERNDPTFEILMHGIDEGVATRCQAGVAQSGQTLAEAIGLAHLLSGYEILEHVFEPAGYSLNALNGSHYATLHVTPESMGSYASFETNRDFRGELGSLVKRVVELFRPRSFDVVAFSPAPGEEQPFETPGYALNDCVHHALGGYDISFFQYYQPVRHSRPAYVFDLDGVELSPDRSP